MARIHIDIDGDFDTFEEAASAVRDAANVIERGQFCAKQPGDANPTIFITENYEDDE